MSHETVLAYVDVHMAYRKVLNQQLGKHIINILFDLLDHVFKLVGVNDERIWQMREKTIFE